MLIDGEKWACEACVRGHRVSNCQHSDRPLQHINKKGRPVSQCPHCRGLRKSRSAHVRCDCGEKPHTPSQCGPVEKADPTRGERSLCCCSHGAKCTCALKKEPPLGSVPEGDADVDLAARRRILHKPRLSATQSEASLMVFANGHHKPGHKHSHMIHKRGTPYRIPKRHASHGGHLDLARRSIENLSATDAVEGAAALSPVKDARAGGPADVRLVRSEHGSPHLSVSPDLGHIRSQLPPLDLSFSNFHPSAGAAAGRASYEMNGWATSPLDAYFCATPDSDQPVFSAGLEPPVVDWSAFDPPLGSGTALTSASHGPRPPYDGFDYGGHPPHGYAASPAASDNDDLTAFGVPSPLHPPSLVFNHFPSDTSDACESDTYRLSNSSSMHGLPQISLLASGDLESMTSEDFLAGAAASFVPGDAVGDPAGPAAGFLPSSYPVKDGPKLAPTSVPAHDKRYSLPLSAEPMPSLWGPPLDGLGHRHSSSPIPMGSEGRGPHAVWAS